ncbi:AAA family ATPase [Streptomyces fradiae]|uniref:AAA family ATPase n=1 Tax=Streptomyces fradiae TaxID=1906 RepID=UPI00294267F6|nr:AAA family ATPase [Streptomyces fradiae]WOI60902.1 AAA family ATPase [Streptomyces fradiae]
MKPMTLTLTGFRSYPTEATVDFTGKSLVAVLGDTGAGKSSLLDAIAFALFRKSSWDAREPRQLIADGAQAMSVELTFVHDGQNWRVHRTMHATNPNAGRHHLKNLDTGEETDGATAVDNRIKTVLHELRHLPSGRAAPTGQVRPAPHRRSQGAQRTAPRAVRCRITGSSAEPGRPPQPHAPETPGRCESQAGPHAGQPAGDGRRSRCGRLTGAITAAEKQGEGQDALAQAALLLKTLAETAEEHRDERDGLVSRTTQLDDESDAIAAADAELAERAARVEATVEEARAAAETSKQIRTRSTAVRTALDAALSAARRVADTARAHATAVDRQESAHKDLGPVEDEASAAHKDLIAAETHLEALRLRKRAAAIAADLHRGDDCPVCCRQLPVDFHPAPADADELAEANTRREQAKSAHDRAVDLRAEARATVTAADKAVLERDHEHRSAQQTAQETTQTAERAFQSLEALATEAGTDFDARSASARLTAATTALAAPAASTTASPHQQHPEQDTAVITHAIAACEHAAAAHAEKLQAEEHRRTAGIEADCKTLAERKKAHHRDKRDASAAQERHARAVTRTAADIGMLPARIRAMLPHNPIDIVVGQTDAATTAVNARQAELQELLDQRETARTEKTAVLADQRTLDHDTRVHLERPLERLRDNLDAWAQAADQARTRLEEADRPALPEAPTQPTIAEVRHYATALSATTSALGDKLTERAAAATERASAAETRLAEHAAALTDIDTFDVPADLTTPTSLHPLVAAAAQATKEAEDQRCRQREAQDLIKAAADLDFAITAGEARYEALEVLRRELVDAKFLGHLTTLRTRALLGVASDLLGQMSDGRFGFADDFDIISRSSGVAHHPNRLSGGEKFMASLALALALAELHSRSGPTLGSLFLDEGFAALDTTALDLALEVLRAQAGGDRLVMVISHLHAVAEAVDDVLWVERTTAGSSTRWLTPAERDDMAQGNLASGLHSQAR